MNLYPAMAFIRHLLTARSAAGHGVHSPFVFDFLTTVVRGKSDTLIIREVEDLRREMLADRRIVRVTDLGAGSAVHKGQERKVSGIAYTAALPPRQLALLSRIAGSIDGVRPDQRSLASAQAEWSILSIEKSGNDEKREVLGVEANLSGKKEKQEPLNKTDHGNLAEGRSHGAVGWDSVESHSMGQVQGGSQAGGQDNGEWSQEQGELSQKHATLPGNSGPGCPGIILELGTSLGISTLAMALAAPERRVVSVEGCPALAEIARENLRRHGAANTEILNMEFSEALSLLRNEGTRVSLAFIDGNHRGEALKQYVSEIRTMGEEMIIVADDIYLNHDMYNSWRSLTDSMLATTASPAPASRKIPPRTEKSPPTHPASPAPASRKEPSRDEKIPQAHPETAPATMETSRFGIIFRRQSLTPRHYRIRY